MARNRTDDAPGNPSEALVSAVRFLSVFLLYVLCIRVLDFLALAGTEAFRWKPLGLPFTLPFILGEELLVGSVLAVILYFLERYRLPRIVFRLVITAYVIWLALEQMTYKYFFSHLDFELYRLSHDVERMWGSIVDAADTSFFVAAGVAILWLAYLWSGWTPEPIRSMAAWLKRRRITAAIVAAAYVGVTYGLAEAGDQHGLERSFPVAAALSWSPSGSERPAGAGQKPEAIIPETTEPAGELAEVQKAIAAYPGRLNVVHYIIESSPFRETSLNPKAQYDTTPFLKSLAGTGLLFENFYVTFPGSTRAAFSMMSGHFPYPDPFSDIAKYAPMRIEALPDILHDEGYATGFFSSSDTMFDSLDTFLMRRKWDKYVDTNMLSEKERRQGEQTFWGVPEQVAIQPALEWIKEQHEDGKPFYVEYVSVYPHHPYRTPPGYREENLAAFGPESKKARYRMSLHYADASVRGLYEGLEKLGVADDTLFIVTPDHGEAFSDVHTENTLHAERLYEENTHIFLILHNPKALGAPRVSKRLGCHPDLLPTVLDALRIRRNLDIDGRSLLAEPFEERPIPLISRRQVGLRDGDYKLVAYKWKKDAELYDLATDPDEQHDLASRQPDRVDRYRRYFEAWRDKIEAGYRRITAGIGLTEEGIKTANQDLRRSFFGGKRPFMKGFSLCPDNACPSEEASEPTVRAGAPLSVRIDWTAPGSYSAALNLFDPDNQPIFSQRYRFDNAETSSIITVDPSLLSKNGRYKVKVVTFEFKIVHDAKSRFFSVSGN